MVSEKNQITVTVHAPRALEPKTFTWEKTMKVGDAAQEAALAFGALRHGPSCSL